MATKSAVPMSAGQRAAFDRDGYLVIRGALRPDEVAAARDALDRVYADAARSGGLNPDGSMHLLGAAANCQEVVGLVDHPATFPCVWSVLGWNIHVYHSHLDVHPRSEHHCRSGSKVRQQLLGGTQEPSGDHAWGHDPATTPLYGWLKERGLLNPAHPPLRP
jgi:hypothetical protein